MITQDDIFGITDDAAFEAAALEVFRRQAAECPPYREYLALAGVRPEEVRAAREIPFLPIEIFKTHDVYCPRGSCNFHIILSSSCNQIPSICNRFVIELRRTRRYT